MSPAGLQSSCYFCSDYMGVLAPAVMSTSQPKAHQESSQTLTQKEQHKIALAYCCLKSPCPHRLCLKWWPYPSLTREHPWGTQCSEQLCVCSVSAAVQAEQSRSWQPGPTVHIQTKVQLMAWSLYSLKYFLVSLCTKKTSEQTEKGRQWRHWLQKSISDILNELSDIIHHSQMLEI